MLPIALKAAPTPATMPPAFVFFDLGNVLVLFDRPRSIRQMASVSRVAERAVADVVHDAELLRALESGRIDWAGFHAEFVRRTGADVTVAALAGSLFYGAVALIERQVTFWHPSQRSRTL